MTHQQNRPQGKFANYIPINERLAAAKDDIRSVITTDPVLFDNSDVFGYIRATITLKDDRVATAIASFRLDATSGAQKTHPFEDAESSAIGRCLAFLGYHVDRAIASKEEVEEAQRREAEYIEQERRAREKESHDEAIRKGRSMVNDTIQEMRAAGLDPSLWPKWPYDRTSVNQLSIDELRAFYKWMDEQLTAKERAESSQAPVELDPEFDEIDQSATFKDLVGHVKTIS
jgi:hypothetical protein